jgi:hypothetical protein
MMTSLPRKPVSSSEAGILASGSGLWMARSKRRWSLNAACVAWTCATVNGCCRDGGDEQGETETEQDERDVCALGADSVADHAQSRADTAPVEHRVERPIDVFVERDVQDVGECEQA